MVCMSYPPALALWGMPWVYGHQPRIPGGGRGRIRIVYVKRQMFGRGQQDVVILAWLAVR